MASAKKGKKNKGKTLALSDFLQDTPGSVQSMPMRKSTLNWADEVEDNNDVYEPRSSKAANVVLPTAPKASRDVEDINDKVPLDPPYIAYLSNLPYDVDEEEISMFFKNMKIASMRIPKDERSGEMPKLKGFGYVEFEDRDSLLNALVLPDTTIKNRRIRIEVSTDYDNDKRRGGRMDMNRDRRGETSTGDWRSGPRQDGPNDANERRGGGGGGGGGGFNRDRERDRDRDENISGAWREGGDRRPQRDSDRGGGGFTRSNYDRDSRDSDFNRRGNDRDRDRDDSRSGGGGGGFMSRGYNRDRDDNRGGGRNNGGGFTRGPPRESRDDAAGADSNRGEPRQRPKLVLAPRTKPVEDADAAPEQHGVEAAPDAPVDAEKEKVVVAEKPTAASIFGNAKPVDTSARERQIEERLAKVQEAAPKRDGSRERSERRRDEREKKDVEKQIEKPSEAERSATPTGDNQNGVEKSHPHAKKNGGDYERKENTESKPKPDRDIKKKEEKRERGEKEMPKLKQQEPPNFIANNKYAYLNTEDSD